MDGSVVLNSVIGLVFVFYVVSLAASGIVEYISKRLGKRGEYLLRGLREMLDIPPSAPSAPPPASAAPAQPAQPAADADAAGAPPPSTPSTHEATDGTADSADPDEQRDLLPPAELLSTLARSGPVTTRSALQSLSKEGLQLGRDLLKPGKETVEVRAALADLVLAHPVVASLHRPTKPGVPPAAHKDGKPPRWGRRDLRLASYLSSRTFTTALLDLLVPKESGATGLDQVQASLNKLPEGIPGRDALLAMARQAGDDLSAFRSSVEHWYDEQMGRVSGWYKRWAQWRLFIVGAVLAVVFNVNSVAVAHTLYRDAPVRDAVVAAALEAEPCPADEGDKRASCIKEQTSVVRDLPLPIGWGIDEARAACQQQAQGENCLQVSNLGSGLGFLGSELVDEGVVGVLLTLLGWLITAAAVSFGAPFWFDALSKLGSLRTAGKRPLEQEVAVSSLPR